MVKRTDTIDEIFEEIWRQRQASPVEAPEAVADPRCIYNRLFEASIQPVCQKALQHPSVIAINQALLVIFLTYMAYREAIPKSHRNHIGDKGHQCIFHLLERTFFSLKGTGLLVLSGEALFELPTPPQPVTIINKRYYDGFSLGETEQEDEDE
jgi:hypothetical protein